MYVIYVDLDMHTDFIIAGSEMARVENWHKYFAYQVGRKVMELVQGHESNLEDSKQITIQITRKPAMGDFEGWWVSIGKTERVGRQHFDGNALL